MNTQLIFIFQNIVVQIYDMDEDILQVKEFEESTKCVLINVNLDEYNFDSFTEIIKIKNSLIDVIKNKSCDNEKLITRLNCKIKEKYETLLEYKNLIA